MAQKIKAAHVIRVFSYGGAEVLLRECFQSPAFMANVESDLFILDHKKLGLIPDVKPYTKKIHFYKITTIWFLFQYIKFLRTLIKGNYDVVHMHLPVAGWMTIVAKPFMRRTKFIYSEHNLVTFYSKYNYYLSGLTYGLFDCVVFVSEEVGEIIRKVQKGWFFKTKKAVTILNGINTEKFSNAHRLAENITDKFTVGLVARFRPQKRVDRWAEVAAEVIKKTDKIQFLMVGDGPSDELLRQRIKELNIEGRIQLPGNQSDTVAAYKQIDIFLLTSDFEGLPLAIMEAMSCGCVPVLSDVGGIKQLELNFGHKFQQFDAEKIAGVIVGYFNNPAKFKTESEQARAFVVQHYSLDKQVNDFIELYNQIKTK